MALSIQKLQDQIYDKERELKSVGSKVRKAGIGAMLTKNPLVGAAAGAYLGHERAERDRLNREISDLKNKIQDNERQIAKLKEKLTQTRNNFQSSKYRIEAETQRKINDLERQKQNEKDPSKQQSLSTQITSLKNYLAETERQNDKKLDAELAAIQSEINSLLF